MRYYLESDGKVFTIERAGSLDLPMHDEIPFEYDEVAPLATSEPVVFCIPHLSRHPREWQGKDELASQEHVTGIVREAIHSTMHRVVVEGLCIDHGKILLVKGSRGLTEGRWSLPGGFLRFGEGSQEGLLREMSEELRVEGRIESFIDVRAKLGETSRLHWIMIFYRISLSGTLDPDPDEIAEARYFSLQTAANLVPDGLMRQMILNMAKAASFQSGT
ncbi:MAG: NUDIX domain-containing protein [Candidatus Bipolaricaulota bacterium]|nr:NUDIX domain-containing protein [Candidatus Bipolaricaulota bacterium]